MAKSIERAVCGVGKDKPLTKDELMFAYPNAVSVSQARRLHMSGAPGRTTPLNHEERRRVIEAPWPTINIWASKSHAGVVKRESIIPDGGRRSWDRAGVDYQTEEESNG